MWFLPFLLCCWGWQRLPALSLPRKETRNYFPTAVVRRVILVFLLSSYSRMGAYRLFFFFVWGCDARSRPLRLRVEVAILPPHPGIATPCHALSFMVWTAYPSRREEISSPPARRPPYPPSKGAYFQSHILAFEHFSFYLAFEAFSFLLSGLWGIFALNWLWDIWCMGLHIPCLRLWLFGQGCRDDPPCTSV